MIAQGTEFPLRKPPGFHYDFLLLGVTTFLAGLLGLPAPNGLIPQAPIHTRSLLIFGEVGEVVSRGIAEEDERRSIGKDRVDEKVKKEEESGLETVPEREELESNEQRTNRFSGGKRQNSMIRKRRGSRSEHETQATPRSKSRTRSQSRGASLNRDHRTSLERRTSRGIAPNVLEGLPKSRLVEPIGVVEQRVSNLAQGSLCVVLCTGPFLHVLGLIPRGVLAGLL